MTGDEYIRYRKYQARLEIIGPKNVEKNRNLWKKITLKISLKYQIHHDQLNISKKIVLAINGILVERVFCSYLRLEGELF